MNSEMQHKWQRLADAQDRSGLSVDAFCAKRGICSTYFYARRKELRILRQDKPRSGFIRLTAGDTFSDHNKSILPAQNIRPQLIARRDPQPTPVPTIAMGAPAPTLSMGVRIQTPNGYSVETVVAGNHGLAEVFGLLRAL